jgi:hypothetical protein
LKVLLSGEGNLSIGMHLRLAGYRAEEGVSRLL